MRSPRRRRLHSRTPLAIAVVVVILAGITGASAPAYTSLKAQSEQLQAQLTIRLQAGQSELEAAKGSLQQANANQDVNLVTQAKAHFVAAKAQFMAASQIADSSQLLHRLQGLPEVGNPARSRHRAVDRIAEMGIAMSNAGLDLADFDEHLIKPPTAGGQEGRTLLTVLEQTNSSLVTVRAALDRAQKAAARVNVHVLPTGQQATFIKARDTIGEALAGLDEFGRIVPVLTQVLGGNGARTYLVEQVNPAELRATNSHQASTILTLVAVLEPPTSAVGVLKQHSNLASRVSLDGAASSQNSRQRLGQNHDVQPQRPLLDRYLWKENRPLAASDKPSSRFPEARLLIERGCWTRPSLITHRGGRAC